MFDLRYHVASLAAVFLMLVVGILIGVGISGRGFVDDAERNRFNARIAGLQEEVDAANATAEDFERRQQAAEDFVDERLSGAGGEPAAGQEHRRPRARARSISTVSSSSARSRRTPAAGSRGCGR